MFGNLRTKKNLDNSTKCYICKKKFKDIPNKKKLDCFSCSRQSCAECSHYRGPIYENYDFVCNKCREGHCCKCYGICYGKSARVCHIQTFNH